MQGSTPQPLIQDSLLSIAAARPDKVAISDETHECTYAGLLDDALRSAAVLQGAGLARGDRVALYLDNTVECASAIFGTLLAGGIFVVVYTQTKAEKLAFILNDSEAAFLVAEGRSASAVAEAIAHAPNVRAVYTTHGEGGQAGFVELQDAIANATTEIRDPGTVPGDLAALIYTSGTTGRPKGVMMSHASFVFAVGSIAQYLRLNADDRILNVLPLAFTYGLNQLLLTVSLGSTLLLERSFAFPAKTLNRLRDQEATVFPAVPTVFATVIGMEHESPYDSVRCLTNAAAGLPPAYHGGLERIFPNAALYRMYGLTECQRVCYLEPHLVSKKPTSVGRAIPGTETLVLDREGAPVEPGEVGMLHVRGPHIMAGYWRSPELTAHMLRDGPIPGETILCTQDYFTLDDDGDLYFVDRSDDIIKTRGEKVSSVEVENALHSIDGIKTAAVIGVPDELLDQAVRAYVVLEEGALLTEQEIIRACRALLESFMVPKRVSVVDALPQTESGKTRKRNLAEQLGASLKLSGRPSPKDE